MPDTALTVKEEEPDVVGVPEIVPEEESVRPAGRVPEMSDQITPEEFAVSVVEYGVPVVPDGRVVVVMVRAEGVGVWSGVGVGSGSGLGSAEAG